MKDTPNKNGEFFFEQTSFQYDTAKYNFYDLMVDMLECPTTTPLHQLHTVYRDRYCRRHNNIKDKTSNKDESSLPFCPILYKSLIKSYLGGKSNPALKNLPKVGSSKNCCMSWSSYNSKFRSSDIYRQFLNLYHQFIREVIAPKISTDDGAVVYQTLPVIRIHMAGCIKGSKKHKDADYFHPSSEINFWMPLTQNLCENNSLYVESEPEKGDFRHVELKCGEVLQFYGNKCEHFAKPNSGLFTRVSLDFRVIPYSRFDESTLVKSSSSNISMIPDYFSLYHPKRSSQGNGNPIYYPLQFGTELDTNLTEKRDNNSTTNI